MLRKPRRRISDLLLPPSREMADAATISSPQKDMGQSWNKPEDGKLMKLGGRQEPNPKKSMAPAPSKAKFLQCQAKNKEN